MQKREVSISLAAVLAGAVTDFFVTNVVLAIFANMVAVGYNVTNARPDWAEYVVLNAIRGNPALFATQTLLGIACSILGGYVAARIAGEDEIENAFAASLISVALNVYIMVAGDHSELPLNIFFTLITPLFYRLGAQIRVVQRSKHK